jgi:hypothetical protein
MRGFTPPPRPPIRKKHPVVLHRRIAGLFGGSLLTLTPEKARVLLMLALAVTRERGAIQGMFERY